MHKLIEYICDELEELERKAEKENKLTMAEIQYADTLAHLKKNLLKSEEMMDEEGEEYSRADGRVMYDGNMRSYARGRGRNAKRDAMGRYSSAPRPRSYGYSYDGGVHEAAESIREIMGELPENVRTEAQRLVSKLESM